MPRSHRSLLAVVGVVSLAISHVGCAGSGAAAGRFETPEACFASVRAAARAQDMPALCRCLTAETQDSLAGLLVVGGSMAKAMGGFAPGKEMDGASEAHDQVTAVNEVFERHGLTDDVLRELAPSPRMIFDPQALERLAGQVKDKAAFISDMLGASSQFAEDNPLSKRFEEQIAGTLKDVKIDGDRATATVVTAAGEDELEFHKAADGWRIHVILVDAAGPMASA